MNNAKQTPAGIERLYTPLDALGWAIDRIDPQNRGDYWHRASELLEAARLSEADVANPPPLSSLATLTRQRDGWREEAQRLQRRLHLTECDIDLMSKHQAKDAWYYQGDGFDHLESMTNRMVVVIHAADLRALIATGPAKPPHVGESAFESWYSDYLVTAPVHQAQKQRARDAYAAGMSDPLAGAIHRSMEEA